MKNVVVLYHASCQDGSGAMFAAWKKFGDNATYLPAQYGKDLPEFEKGPDVEVFMLDFSVSKEALESLRSLCKRVRVIDHHATAQEALQGDSDAFFDMSKSGAVLAWEEFHPNDPVPMLLQFVQDRDLWQFKFPDTKAVHAGLGMVRGGAKAWNNYAMASWALDELIDRGETLLERDRLAVEAKVPYQVKVIRFDKYDAGIINTGELVSEVGEAIYNSEELKVDLAIMYFITKDNGVVLSMRSKKGGVNVGELCKKLGGGGHPSSAGCKVDFKTLQHILNDEWWTE